MVLETFPLRFASEKYTQASSGAKFTSLLRYRPHRIARFVQQRAKQVCEDFFLFSCVGVADDDADESVFGSGWLLSGENANSSNGNGWFCSF